MGVSCIYLKDCFTSDNNGLTVLWRMLRLVRRSSLLPSSLFRPRSALSFRFSSLFSFSFKCLFGDFSLYPDPLFLRSSFLFLSSSNLLLSFSSSLLLSFSSSLLLSFSSSLLLSFSSSLLLSFSAFLLASSSLALFSTVTFNCSRLLDSLFFSTEFT